MAEVRDISLLVFEKVFVCNDICFGLELRKWCGKQVS